MPGLKVRLYVSIILNICFVVTSVAIPPLHANVVERLPVPGQMVALSEPFEPLVVRGLKIFADDPFRFDFILRNGDQQLSEAEFESESLRLIRYFLAAMTIPDGDLWVNLSPFEEDRIIPTALGFTEMGRDLLGQDYILKQLTASLVYPEEELGEEFWDEVYMRAADELGTTDIPLNTFNKVWIVPDQTTVYEHVDTAYVVESRLKVLLENDYLAEQSSLGQAKFGSGHDAQSATAVNALTAEVMKEIIIPAIEEEVNHGENFAVLRSVFHSLILAQWYKETIEQSLLNAVYVDQNKITGIDIEERDIKDKIYQQYIDAYRRGVYDYIREEYDPMTQEIVPKKYFSGGITADVDLKVTTVMGDSELRAVLNQDSQKGLRFVRIALKAMDKLKSIIRLPGNHQRPSPSTVQDVLAGAYDGLSSPDANVRAQAVAQLNISVDQALVGLIPFLDDSNLLRRQEVRRFFREHPTQAMGILANHLYGVDNAYHVTVGRMLADLLRAQRPSEFTLVMPQPDGPVDKVATMERVLTQGLMGTSLNTMQKSYFDSLRRTLNSPLNEQSWPQIVLDVDFLYDLRTEPRADVRQRLGGEPLRDAIDQRVSDQSLRRTFYQLANADARTMADLVNRLIQRPGFVAQAVQLFDIPDNRLKWALIDLLDRVLQSETASRDINRDAEAALFNLLATIDDSILKRDILSRLNRSVQNLDRFKDVLMREFMAGDVLIVEDVAGMLSEGFGINPELDVFEVNTDKGVVDFSDVLTAIQNDGSAEWGPVLLSNWSRYSPEQAIAVMNVLKDVAGLNESVSIAALLPDALAHSSINTQHVASLISALTRILNSNKSANDYPRVLKDVIENISLALVSVQPVVKTADSDSEAFGDGIAVHNGYLQLAQFLVQLRSAADGNRTQPLSEDLLTDEQLIGALSTAAFADLNRTDEKLIQERLPGYGQGPVSNIEAAYNELVKDTPIAPLTMTGAIIRNAQDFDQLTSQAQRRSVAFLVDDTIRALNKKIYAGRMPIFTIEDSPIDDVVPERVRVNQEFIAYQVALTELRSLRERISQTAGDDRLLQQPAQRRIKRLDQVNRQDFNLLKDQIRKQVQPVFDRAQIALPDSAWSELLDRLTLMDLTSDNTLASLRIANMVMAFNEDSALAAAMGIIHDVGKSGPLTGEDLFDDNGHLRMGPELTTALLYSIYSKTWDYRADYIMDQVAQTSAVTKQDMLNLKRDNYPAWAAQFDVPMAVRKGDVSIREYLRQVSQLPATGATVSQFHIPATGDSMTISVDKILAELSNLPNPIPAELRVKAVDAAVDKLDADADVFHVDEDAFQGIWRIHTYFSDDVNQSILDELTGENKQRFKAIADAIRLHHVYRGVFKEHYQDFKNALPSERMLTASLLWVDVYEALIKRSFLNHQVATQVVLDQQYLNKLEFRPYFGGFARPVYSSVHERIRQLGASLIELPGSELAGHLDAYRYHVQGSNRVLNSDEIPVDVGLVIDTLTGAMDDDQVGGIDLNTIDVDRQGNGLQIQMNSSAIQPLLDNNFEGFVPNVMHVIDIPSVFPLLGLQDEEEGLSLSKK
jgi:hypothetical protein